MHTEKNAQHIFELSVVVHQLLQSAERARVEVERLQREPPESLYHSLTESPASDAIERVVELAREVDRELHEAKRTIARLLRSHRKGEQ